MKLRLVSFACAALALLCASSRPVAGSAIRVAEEFAAPGGAPSISGESSIAYFDTLEQLKARTRLPDGLTHVYVRAVAGKYPPPAGTDATPLWYRLVGSATGIWGEVTLASGQILDPVYSTNPVQIGEFGVVADGTYSFSNGAHFTATSSGSNTISVSSTKGCAAGMRVTTSNWATRTAASLPIIPAGTTILSVGSGALALSASVPEMTSVPTICWADNMAGTDNASAIQAALDFGMRNKYSDFKFPNGNFLVAASLNAGWGAAYAKVNIHGDYRASYMDRPGTRILFSQFDQPAINFQGVLASGMKGISIIGRNYNYLNFAQGRPSWSPNKADWIAPEFSPASTSGGLQVGAPFAGVTEDAYCGTTPTIPYPNLTFPSWTGITKQYGKIYSSDFSLEEMEIDGFAVSYANGLNCSAQADFTKIWNVAFNFSAFDISVTNTQSRNVYIENIKSGWYHTIITNSNFGSTREGGQFNGPLSNISGYGGYQIFDLGRMGYIGPVKIDNMYAESTVRIGNFTGNNQYYPSPVIFNGGMFYSYDGMAGQAPPSFISADAYTTVTLSGTQLFGGQRISNVMDKGGALKFKDGGSWVCAIASPTTAAQLAAINYTGGCFAGGAVIQDPISATYYSDIGAAASGAAQQSMLAANKTGATRVPMTQGITQFRDQGNRLWNMTVPPPFLVNTGYRPQVGTPVALSNDVMTFGYCSFYQTGQPIAVGNIIYNAHGSTLFVVTSVGGPTANSNCSPSSSTSVLVTARQQNNLNLVPRTSTFLSNNITAASITGYLTVYNGTQVTLPTHLYFGTFTSGNTTISNVSDGVSGGSLASYLAVNDNFLSPGQATGHGDYSTYGGAALQWPIPAGGVALSAVTNGNLGSIVMSAPARGAGIFPIFPFELRP